MLFWPRPAGGPLFPSSDKVVHLGLFLLLAAAARWRFGALRRVLVAVLVYAAVSELVQAVALDNRSGDVLDLLADAAGAVLGWFVAGRLLSPAR